MSEDSSNEQVADNTQYSDEDFLEAIEAGNKATADIADFAGCTRKTAEIRLKRLRADGQVESEKVGSSLVWSLRE